MQQGVISLRPIYAFVGKHRKQCDEHGVPFAYHMRGSDLGGAYCSKCDHVLSEPHEVPKQRGFYLWGFYNKKKFWVNVYLGKADLRKTAHLRDRLYKELTAERAFAWREFYEKEKVVGFDLEYPTEVKRALRKAGSTHIFWVATPDLAVENVDPAESDLIEAMNPTGNRQRRLPSTNVQKEAEQILGILRAMIYLQENRQTQFNLKYHKEFWKWVGNTEPPTP